jgi:ketosteroid isomerase-like protein
MKNILFLFLFAWGHSLSAQADIELIFSNMKLQEAAWNNGDIEGFMQYYWKSDSLKFIGKNGVTNGWQKTFENYKRSYPDKQTMGTLKFTIIESTQLCSDAVYVIGKWELQRERPVSGHFTLLWRKIGNKWVIVSDHTS